MNRSRISAGPTLVADGAMGTMLHRRGAPVDCCCDELNLSSPDLVKQIHEDYVNAGAEVLETNTFGGNRMRLSRFHLADELKAINEAGVKIARAAAGNRAFVAGAAGPSGVPIERNEARAIFREQVEALVAAGIDLLILETFYDLDELEQAVLAAREVAGDEMVIVAQVTAGPDRNPEIFTPRLDRSSADVIGCNCSAGPQAVLETIQKMRLYSAKPLSAMPSAGVGTHCTPEEFARYAVPFMKAGVRLMGGCCGTTPEHIGKLKNCR